MRNYELTLMKEWEGMTEKEFDVILFAHANIISDGVVEYKFQTQTNGKHPAKTPFEMFNDYEIDNDLNLVINEIEKYDN